MSIEEEIGTLREMLLNSQEVISKTSEIIQRMYEVFTDLKARVEVLEDSGEEQ